ncbi:MULTISPECIES: hypothetical protein [Halomonas]|nr:hypothetical protein [Halomonas colorata]
MRNDRMAVQGTPDEVIHSDALRSIHDMAIDVSNRDDRRVAHYY